MPKLVRSRPDEPPSSDIVTTDGGARAGVLQSAEDREKAGSAADARDARLALQERTETQNELSLVDGGSDYVACSGSEEALHLSAVEV